MPSVPCGVSSAPFAVISRPSTPDGLPVIGEAPRHRGLFFAFGHGHIGLSNGPITGQVIGDLLLGREAAFDLAPFSATRF